MYVEQIRLMAERLVDTAKCAGVHVTISTRPLEPLAMRNYDLVVDAWPSRGGGPIEKPRDVHMIDAIGHALEDALAALDHQHEWITPPEIDGVVHALYRAGLPIALRRAVGAMIELSPEWLAAVRAQPADSHAAVVDGQAIFINRGTSDADYSDEAAHLNCPACRGSGHVDDVAAIAASVAEQLPTTNFDPQEVARRACLLIAEMDDRTSPEDWPEAMLVTSDELFAIIIEAFADSIQAAPVVQAADGEDGPEGGWCPSCGCGNDMHGFAHGPICRAERAAEQQFIYDTVHPSLDDNKRFAQHLTAQAEQQAGVLGDERATKEMLMLQIEARALLALQGAKLAEPSDAIDRLTLASWVAQRWHAEVANRPLVNVNRRPLDDAWRQMLRHLGVDDEARLGPRHDELVMDNPQLFRGAAKLADAQAHADAADAAKYRALNTPEIANFLTSVHNEALHHRDRWSTSGDAGKSDADWFWLVGYLVGKAIRPQSTREKQLHHIITAAAALLNWHGARVGAYLDMRPGYEVAAAEAPKERT